MDIEIGSSAQSLPDHFDVLFDSEMSSEGAQIHITCLHHEKVCAAVAILDVISWSALHVEGNCLVIRCKCITEVRVEDSAITILVISPDEQIHIIFVRVGAELVERFDDLGCSNPALAILIKHLVCIHQVEVRLKGQTSLCLIRLQVKSDELSEGRYELFFLIKL